MQKQLAHFESLLDVPKPSLGRMLWLFIKIFAADPDDDNEEILQVLNQKLR